MLLRLRHSQRGGALFFSVAMFGQGARVNPADIRNKFKLLRNRLPFKQGVSS